MKKTVAAAMRVFLQTDPSCHQNKLLSSFHCFNVSMYYYSSGRCMLRAS